MKKLAWIVIMLSSTGFAQEGSQRQSSLEIDMRNSQYSSILGSFFFKGSHLSDGSYGQLGIGVGNTTYEVNGTQKAIGWKSALTLQTRKEIVPKLSLSQGIFAGYEKVNFDGEDYKWNASSPGYGFYGIDFGFSYQDRDSRMILTTGVSISDYDLSSKSLKSSFNQEGLMYPKNSIAPFLKVGVSL